jgi:hypothetical protein
VQKGEVRRSLGVIASLDRGFLATLGGTLDRLTLRMHLLSVKVYSRGGLSAPQQWQLQKRGKALDHAGNDGVGR